ncbi:MAG: hypothetical protein HKN79_11340 [Flavobacteriales bacterium]|nr:hypothetical protein [Flavobacteriales bacterium]
MKGNWTQTLVFTILALVLGFVLGKVTGHRGPHHGDKMEKRIFKKHMGDGDHMVWHDEEGGEMEIIRMDGGMDDMQSAVEALEDSGFEGDTLIDGANISISRDGDEVSVEVKKEMEGDGLRKEIRIEKEIK